MTMLMSMLMAMVVVTVAVAALVWQHHTRMPSPDPSWLNQPTSLPQEQTQIPTLACLAQIPVGRISKCYYHNNKLAESANFITTTTTIIITTTTTTNFQAGLAVLQAPLVEKGGGEIYRKVWSPSQ